MSRRMVRIWVKEGESMRSDVSSRSRRREGRLATGVCCGGGDVDAGGGLGAERPEGGEGEALMPDSRRTASSWSEDGRRC